MGAFFGLEADLNFKICPQTGFGADSESKSSESERIRSQIFWTLPIFDLQQLVASNFARNGKSSKRELFLNVIVPFSIIARCLVVT